MTPYLPVYDVEYLQDVEYSLRALASVVKVHRRMAIPATLCICGQLLDRAGPRYAELLRDDLFDIHSHTYTHMRLKRSNDCEPPVDLARARDELERTAALLEKHLGVTNPGLRTPGGFYRGLRGATDLLALLDELGVPFVSSDARGPMETIPSPLTEPYWYDEDGFPGLLELPAQDWHENVLKGHSPVPCTWPPILPWGYPSQAPKTPEEEFEVYRKSLHGVVEMDLTYYSPPMHPWSVYRFNPEARTVELILEEVGRLGMPVTTFSAVQRELRARREGT
ncbi:MAG: polysaccharide deacetylase family protein [Armatimonadota bacterium]|nr:MAG: polysaccharide deacetylase family protein [Armatimonadota bacterium]